MPMRQNDGFDVAYVRIVAADQAKSSGVALECFCFGAGIEEQGVCCLAFCGRLALRLGLSKGARKSVGNRCKV
jgi:hypothetical protein